MKVADLRPASSPGLASTISVPNPRSAAQRSYIRRSISVKSCASVPPASDWIVTTASPASYSPVNSAASSSRSSSRTSGSSDFAISASIPPSIEKSSRASS